MKKLNADMEKSNFHHASNCEGVWEWALSRKNSDPEQQWLELSTGMKCWGRSIPVIEQKDE